MLSFLYRRSSVVEILWSLLSAPLDVLKFDAEPVSPAGGASGALVSEVVLSGTAPPCSGEAMGSVAVVSFIGLSEIGPAVVVPSTPVSSC
ncbi:hypothetical protein C0Q70_13159 [Pomacea canaliculata]|uniref:Uncharacterized protein n=1 Tax=Pomacea canaliculata TaxID=400727 RepID=A0A2T7NWF3_POMCA|nr:hypothetical protein C0Q70_13159 [Pomacea canaliculata]